MKCPNFDRSWLTLLAVNLDIHFATQLTKRDHVSIFMYIFSPFQLSNYPFCKYLCTCNYFFQSYTVVLFLKCFKVSKTYNFTSILFSLWGPCLNKPSFFKVSSFLPWLLYVTVISLICNFNLLMTRVVFCKLFCTSNYVVNLFCFMLLTSFSMYQCLWRKEINKLELELELEY